MPRLFYFLQFYLFLIRRHILHINSRLHPPSAPPPSTATPCASAGCRAGAGYPHSIALDLHTADNLTRDIVVRAVFQPANTLAMFAGIGKFAPG